METSPAKDEQDTDASAVVSTIIAGGLGSPTIWTSQAMSLPISVPQAHATSVAAQTMPPVPPPAHAHSQPATNIDKGLLDAAAFLEGKSMSLPVKTADSPGTGDSSLSWAIQNTLLQQYGQIMLDRMLNKQSTESSSTVTTSDVAAATSQIAAVLASSSQAGQKSDADPEAALAASSLEAQRDVYRRMLNYSMSSALTQQYYLSQYGYNYIQDRSLFTRSDSNQTNTATASTSAATLPASASTTQSRGQLPSIDSVLLNLSTKKTRESSETKTIPGTISGATVNTHTSVSSVPAYGLQALANAAIEADPKAFSEAHGTSKDLLTAGHKSELEDISDTDESNMSPSDSSTSQILSPPRSTYSHLMDTASHISSIPSAHSQFPSTFQHNLLSSKAGIGTLPSIQHFSANKQPDMAGTGMSGVKPSDLSGMKVKIEPSEEKELADRAIQEQIAAHQLNAVQQQVHDLTAQTLAAGGLDAAALLAKLPLAAGMEAELHRHIEKMYEYDPEALQALQQEPMELTSDLLPGKAGSRRKSRGRPTSIESQRDPLGRQSSTSSLGANTSYDGDGEERTYDCDICGKQFSHNDRLRRHRKIHTTEKPYKCDICGKGFKEKCNLKHHRYIHTGEKPYKCDTCGKSFNQRSSLKTHQKVHTGEKPFKCELCDKPFAQKYLLRQHMKKHIEIPTQQ